MTKLLKTDRTGRLEKVARYKQRKSTVFKFMISPRRCANKDDASVRARISYCGQDTGYFSTGIIAKWNDIDVKKFQIHGDSQKTSILVDLRARAERIFADCRLTGRAVDLLAIRDALHADDRVVASTPNIQQLVDQWLTYNQAREDTGEIVKRTMWKNKRWTNDFWAFAKQKYGAHARLSDLKAADIKGFVIWLRQIRHLSNNTAQSTASHAKVLMNYALDQEWMERNPFINFKRKMDTVERETLTEFEIKQFCTFPLESPALMTLRDIFFFMCLTGLSYADVQKLTERDIKAVNGESYLHISRQKMLSRTDSVPATIPLSTPALAIIAKNGPVNTGQPLIKLQANAPFNRGLKQIAAMCGLDKSISTKVARNSLATYLINKGVPLISVSAILGHSSTMTTQKYYTKVSPERVLSDISDLNTRLNSSGLFGIE